MSTDTRDTLDALEFRVPGLSEDELAEEGVVELPDRPLMCGFGFFSSCCECCCCDEFEFEFEFDD